MLLLYIFNVASISYSELFLWILHSLEVVSPSLVKMGFFASTVRLGNSNFYGNVSLFRQLTGLRGYSCTKVKLYTLMKLDIMIAKLSSIFTTCSFSSVFALCVSHKFLFIYLCRWRSNDTRVWVMYSIIPISVITAVAIYMCFMYLPHRTPAVYRRNVLATASWYLSIPHFFSHMLPLWCAAATCLIIVLLNFIAYVALERNLRREYTMTKLIKNEFELHQRANDTTKMLAYNILPVDIVTRYSFIILFMEADVLCSDWPLGVKFPL